MEKSQMKEAQARKFEEKLFEMAVGEVKSGKQKEALWIKAGAMPGDQRKNYVLLRVRSMKDQMLLAKKANEDFPANKTSVASQEYGAIETGEKPRSVKTKGLLLAGFGALLAFAGLMGLLPGLFLGGVLLATGVDMAWPDTREEGGFLRSRRMAAFAVPFLGMAAWGVSASLFLGDGLWLLTTGGGGILGMVFLSVVSNPRMQLGQPGKMVAVALLSCAVVSGGVYGFLNRQDLERHDEAMKAEMSRQKAAAEDERDRRAALTQEERDAEDESKRREAEKRKLADAEKKKVAEEKMRIAEEKIREVEEAKAAAKAADNRRGVFAYGVGRVLKQALHDPQSARDVNAQISKGKKDPEKMVLCMELRAKNGFGAMVKSSYVFTEKGGKVLGGNADEHAQTWNSECVNQEFGNDQSLNVRQGLGLSLFGD